MGGTTLSIPGSSITPGLSEAIKRALLGLPLGRTWVMDTGPQRTVWLPDMTMVVNGWSYSTHPSASFFLVMPLLPVCG